MTIATNEVTLQAARSPWSGHASREELVHWRRTAEDVAAALSSDVLERDRRNADPHAEVQLLRESGLLNLLIPAVWGGGDGHWESALNAVRILARTDASIAQVLAYHYANLGAVVFYGDPGVQERLLRRSAQSGWSWGDSVNPVDPSLELIPDGSGYRLQGTKHFSTGASVGNAILVNAVVTGGENNGKLLALVVDHDRSGIEYLGDWDALGQRLSASGSVKYSGVLITPEDIIGEVGEEPFSTLVTPYIQLAFGNLYLGIAQGALERGRGITLGRRNAWFLSKAETYAQDPLTQRIYGELDSRIAAVEALADRTNHRFDGAIAAGGQLTAQARAEIAIEIARLKVVSSEVGVDTANRIFEVTGSSSAKTAVGLDLYWRNVRTHSLHDPVDYKKVEVGARYLLGEVQPISLYT
ncbi:MULTISPECIES: acyl-CoA dehydrogenase family protein [Arthrobacter]|uniref:acyl-CoA dehydrogenase family protein n=1 Tax=Arthrobacter TaxID=1663 RepID=UPI0006DA0F0B|nr:acyl-CoA dehydrogenase family protein [Arthrobacter sp. Edens01]KPN18146.1 acyl-CoA dehydrogenase [Arthrobacter sp. Edens01]